MTCICYDCTRNHTNKFSYCPSQLSKELSEDDMSGGSVSERTGVYTTSKNLLMNSADAWERLMTSYKEVRGLEDRTSLSNDTKRWMDGWIDGWIDGWMDGWKEGWMDRQTDGWTDGWTDEWINKWTDGRLDRRTDGRIDGHITETDIMKYCYHIDYRVSWIHF